MSIEWEVVKISPPIVFLDGIATFYLPCGISHQEELRLIRQYLEFDCPDPLPKIMFINYPEKDICYSLCYDRTGPVIKNVRNFIQEHFYKFDLDIMDLFLFDGRRVVK